MLPFNSVVVNTGSKLVAIDTGFGPGALATSNGSMGQGQANLAASGIDIKNIDAVVISHFHGDHINGLVTDGKPSYPNAEVMVPAPEWDFWMDDGNMSRGARGDEGRVRQCAARVRHHRQQDDQVRAWQGCRAGHRIGCRARSFARPYHACRFVRQFQPDDPGRSHHAAATVRTQPRLARDVRHGRAEGRGNPPRVSTIRSRPTRSRCRVIISRSQRLPISNGASRAIGKSR